MTVRQQNYQYSITRLTKPVVGTEPQRKRPQTCDTSKKDDARRRSHRRFFKEALKVIIREHGLCVSSLAHVRFSWGRVEIESVLQNVVFLEFWISFATCATQRRFKLMFPVVLWHQRAGAAERRLCAPIVGGQNCNIALDVEQKGHFVGTLKSLQSSLLLANWIILGQQTSAQRGPLAQMICFTHIMIRFWRQKV